MKKSSKLPYVIAAGASLFFALFFTTAIHKQLNDNWSGPFFFGERFYDQKTSPKNSFVGRGVGYDGQFFYRVALNPLLPFSGSLSLSDPVVRSSENLAHRHRRITYPLLARSLAFGNPDWFLFSFPLVSIISIGLGTYAACRYFEACGRHCIWGMFYAALPGLSIAVSRNVGEPVAIASLAIAFLAFQRRRHGLAVFFLTLAHFTHETTLIISAGIAGYLILQKKQWRTGFLYLIPIILILAWARLLLEVTTFFPLGLPTRLLGIPLAGVAAKLAALSKDPFNFVEWAMMCALLLSIAVLIRSILNRSSPFWIANLLCLLFIFSFSYSLLCDISAYGRALLMIMLLALLATAEAPGKLAYLYFGSLSLATLCSLKWWWTTWELWQRTGI